MKRAVVPLFPLMCPLSLHRMRPYTRQPQVPLFSFCTFLSPSQFFDGMTLSHSSAFQGFKTYTSMAI